MDLKIRYDNGYFQIFVPKERLTSSSARIFAFWITFPAVLVISIAMIFLKNQTRPIRNLAEASEKFGRRRRNQRISTIWGTRNKKSRLRI